MKILLKQFIVLSLLVITAGISAADTLSVTKGQLSASTLGIKVPKRWMTKEQVEARFGKPLSKSGPVGKQPYTYWVYDKYTVYFEKNQVLDTVRNLPAQKQNGKTGRKSSSG